MNLKLLFKSSEQYLVDILTGIAVAGTITTAYLAAQGAFKSACVMMEKDAEKNAGKKPEESLPLTRSETIQLTWMNYLPAVGSAALTVGCIVCANRISTKRIAAMAAAYSLSESKIKEYKDKVAEKFGIEKAEDVEDEIIHDKIQHGPSQTIILGEGEQLCFDAYSGRYFRNTYNAIQQAANQINQLVIKENYQTLDDFWDLIGLEATAYGVENGWNVDQLLEIEMGTMMSSDNKPCLVVKYDAVPIRGWNH
jgi:hypothetical protein